MAIPGCIQFKFGEDGAAGVDIHSAREDIVGKVQVGGKRFLLVGFSQLGLWPEEAFKSFGRDESEFVILDFFSFLHPHVLNPNRASLALRYWQLRNWRSEVKAWRAAVAQLEQNIPTQTRSDTRWAFAQKLRARLLSFHIESDQISIVKLSNPTFGLKAYFSSVRNVLDEVKQILSAGAGKVEVMGIESGAYLLDSLQRYVRGFRVERKASLLNLLVIIPYLRRVVVGAYAVNELLKRERFDVVVVNHEVYMESGWIAALGAERFGLEILFVGGKKKLPIPIAPRTRSFELELSSVSSGDEPEPYGADLERFRARIPGVIGNLDSKRVDPTAFLIFMHCFGDANDLHWRRGQLFASYFHWIEYTLDVAQRHPSCKYVFRVHPLIKYFPRDRSTLRALFAKKPENVEVQYPGQYSGHSDETHAPVVVTARGTISLELATNGFRTVSVSWPHSPEGTFVKPTSRAQYAKILSGSFSPDQFLLDDYRTNRAKLYRAKLHEIAGLPDSR